MEDGCAELGERRRDGGGHFIVCGGEEGDEEGARAKGDHGVLIFFKNGEFPQKIDRQKLEAHVVPPSAQEWDEETDNVAFTHLPLDVEVFGEVEEGVDGGP